MNQKLCDWLKNHTGFAKNVATWNKSKKNEVLHLFGGLEYSADRLWRL